MMLVVYDAKFNGQIDRTLLRYWQEWMRAKKAHRAHVQRIYTRSTYCQKRREMRVLDAEIRVLRLCIHQVHLLRGMKKRAIGDS